MKEHFCILCETPVQKQCWSMEERRSVWSNLHSKLNSVPQIWGQTNALVYVSCQLFRLILAIESPLVSTADMAAIKSMTDAYHWPVL